MKQQAYINIQETPTIENNLQPHIIRNNIHKIYNKYKHKLEYDRYSNSPVYFEQKCSFNKFQVKS